MSRTLKDIEDSLTTTIIFPDDLRELVREWIKELRDHRDIDIINFLKERFNLEEK